MEKWAHKYGIAQSKLIFNSVIYPAASYAFQVCSEYDEADLS